MNMVFVFLLVLGFLVGCSQQPEKHIDTYIVKNFECKARKSVNGSYSNIITFANNDKESDIQVKLM